MGLNDRKKIVEDAIKAKEDILYYLAKKNWEAVCETFNNPEENYGYLSNGNKQAEMFVDVQFSFSGTINGKETQLGLEEIVNEMKQSFPKDYEYFKYLVEGGVEYEEIEFVPTKLFRTGHSKVKVKKAQILKDIEKLILELAKEENAKIELRFCKGNPYAFYPSESHPFDEDLYIDFKTDNRDGEYKATIRVNI